MRTAIDTSALLAIFLDEPDAGAWVDLLIQCRSDGELICCDIVLAEIAPLFADREGMDLRLADLGIRMVPCAEESAFLAGRLFAEYRGLGGPRTHLIPDFLVGAHATAQADRLAAADRGYLRRFFAALPIVSPANPS
jgi:predicted nucleic acid-binding protein